MLFDNGMENNLALSNKIIQQNVNSCVTHKEDRYEFLLSINNLFFQEEYERIINYINEIYPTVNIINIVFRYI